MPLCNPYRGRGGKIILLAAERYIVARKELIPYVNSAVKGLNQGKSAIYRYADFTNARLSVTSARLCSRHRATVIGTRELYMIVFGTIHLSLMRVLNSLVANSCLS